MNRFVQTIKAIRDVLLIVLLFVSAISYHPTIINMSRIAGYESGTIMSRYIILLFGAVLFLSFNLRLVLKSKLIRTYLLWLFIICVVALIVQAFYDNNDMIHDLRSFIIVLGSIIIGYDLKLKRNGFALFVLVFCLTSLFSGIMQVLVNVGGFRITDQYLTDAKNSLGAMLATACFSLIYLYRSSKKSLFKVALFLGWGVTLIVIVTIRARMAIVALTLVGMYYYYLIKRNKNLLIAYLVIFVVVFFGLLFMPSSIVDYLDASFTAGTQGDDFTSGRLSTYLEALSFLATSPLLGNVMKINQIGWVHNYLLWNIYRFGLLFSFPIIVLFFLIFFNSLKQSLKCSPDGRECFAYVCLLIPFLISLAEPTFPFGPGTVTLFNFILLGMAEQKKLKNESISGL